MNSFQQIADQVDLKKAVRGGSAPNDLLPPRHEDNVVGEVGKNFSAALLASIKRGTYDPTPADFVNGPKQGITTRPAALLTLTDRVVYEALVEILRTRIEAALLGEDTLLWPRGHLSAKQWRRFESLPLESGYRYVVRADISAYYESIDHILLRHQLMESTGLTCAVDALYEFLNRILPHKKGLPQGLAPSDPLASVFLVPVDSAMARSNICYYRHGDDIRIAVDSYSNGREAIYLLEQQLRARGLSLNNPKTIIMGMEKYKATFDAIDARFDNTRRDLLAARIKRLQSDEEALQDLLSEDSDFEELGWALFYHQNLTFEQVIEKLQDHIAPADAEVAAGVLKEAVQSLEEDNSPMEREDAYQRLSVSLTRLASGKSPDAIQYLPRILAVFSDKAEHAVAYLRALKKSDAKKGLRVIRSYLKEDIFHTPWEKSWHLQLFGHFSEFLTDWDIQFVKSIAVNEEEGGICRAEAVKVLGRLGMLEHQLLRRLWNLLHPALKADLVAAAYYASRAGCDWAKLFIEGAKEDPVNKVVLRHLEGNKEGRR